MSCTVIVAHNPFDRNSWLRTEQVHDLGEFILKEFAPVYGDSWPQSARIYLEAIDGEHDITPITPAMAETLHKVEGTAYIMVWPQGPAIAVPILINFGIAMAIHVIRGASGDDRLRAGGPRKGVNRALPKGSPNNVPGLRQNTARIEERIPDIFGRVRSTPDLLAVPYVVYVDNLQQEISYMCIGRGEFDIQANDVREGDTRVSQLLDTSVEIYAPGDIPMGFDPPQLSIGEPINEPVFTVVPIESAKGDLLKHPNTDALYGDDLMVWRTVTGGAFPSTDPFNRPVKFFYASTGVGVITLPNFDVADIAARFPVGTKFGMEWTVESVTVQPRELVTGSGGVGNVPNLRTEVQVGPSAGTLPDTADENVHYEVTAISVNPSDVILTVSVPAYLQPEWDKLILYNTAGTGGSGYEVTAAGEIYNTGCIMYPLIYRLGPYFVDDPDMEFIKLNFVADKGIYADDGVTQFAQFRRIVVEVTPADANGNPSGTKVVSDELVMAGSAFSRDFIGITVNYFPPFTGRFLISVYNSTNTVNRHPSWSWESYNRHTFGTGFKLKPWDGVTDSKQFKGNIQDEIRWTHGYSMSEPPNVSFGNVTTVHAKVVQRKNQRPPEAERRLNMIVTRKLPAWDGSALTGFAANRTGRDALFSLLVDSDIGDIPDEQIDFSGIADAFEAVDDAFGDAASTTFDHTFDSDNASLEDMLAAIGDSCFIQVYRESDVLKASPDVSTENATLLFNHRNKVPGTETRSVSFGTEEDYDGIKIEYADDTDDRIKNVVIPTEGATKKPKRISPAGIRLRAKASMHAWRAYNELLYKKTYVEFDSCEEAALSFVNDRIIVADNTRREVQDGDILAVDGLDLKLSQTTILAGDSYIFVQHTDGTVESIAIASQANANVITLASAPAIAIYIDSDNGIYPRYSIVRSSSTAHKAFRVLEKSYKGPGLFSITGYNYSDGYYFDDGINFKLSFKSITGNPSIGVFTDRGPYAVSMSAQGGVGTTTDITRGSVYNGLDIADFINVGGSFTTNILAFSSYTIAAWIKKNDGVNASTIVSSRDNLSSSNLIFQLGGSSTMSGIHDAVTYVSGTYTANQWQHLALTYNSVTLVMCLYRDGEIIDSAAAVPNFSSLAFPGTDGLRLFAFTSSGGLLGRADDLRFYRVEKTSEFIRELYQRTRIQ